MAVQANHVSAGPRPSEKAVLTPDSFRQFGDGASAFFLVTDAELASSFSLGESRYARSEILGVAAGADLGRLIAELPESAAVLVAAPGLFVRSTDLDGIGDRRVAVVPCGSTPVRADHLRYFLDVAAETDPVAQTAFAARFFDAVAEAGELRMVDERQRTECVFDASDEDHVWNQQAGVLEPGEQQIAPAGELSVLPMEITGFDPARRFALSGTLTLSGEPIVHAGYDPALAAVQAELYGKLAALRRHPVVLTVEAGLIVHCRAGTPSPEGIRAARALDELFGADAAYRTVWEIGFGINTEMSVIPANCGPNEVYGGKNGVVHLGIGLTPFTRFALTFLCQGTSVTDGAGAAVFGGAGAATRTAARRRIKRTRDASCGCH